mmetsp:Transcript_3579/g.6989  ORF Transcript_3579/g.6989 Transcript_3579/m.6989 type:complete len:381 (+) Transcript_3579:63-1205(+)|eukprot:CAMPEP_0172725238 /NCGR_PEP_ID=MMETSP1074-20121228/87886_1 /TAXON_ID=2916 /ORGANISM="Ceratium fusus, Strain PA161109" /LENGTH=380 /DNA_ID=CAMNT_0013551959 /DNA_START=52 /DNA_END=1194 /DNA_ORIENTATION=+
MSGLLSRILFEGTRHPTFRVKRSLCNNFVCSHRIAGLPRTLTGCGVAVNTEVASLQMAFLQRRNLTAQPRDLGMPVKGMPMAGSSSALADLTERGGLMPKPETFDERLKPGFRGGRALFLFFLCNAVPFSAVLYYFREQRTQRTQMSLLTLPATADDVAAEALRVVRTASACFLVQRSGSSSGQRSTTVRVDPHAPEGTAYVPPTEPLPLVPQMPRNEITDVFESPSTPGLRYIHFAISRQSVAAAPVLAGERQASLLYISASRAAYCNVGGQLSILSDPEARRRFWRPHWALSFPPGRRAESAARQGSHEAEPPPLWQHEDYILLRLAVNEVSLQAAEDGPQRWEERRVCVSGSLPGAADEEGSAKWALVSSDGTVVER